MLRVAPNTLPIFIRPLIRHHCAFHTHTKKTAAFIIVAKPAIRQGGRGVLAKDDQPLLRPSFPSLMSTNSPGAFVAWRRKGRRCIEGKETREGRRKEGVDGYKQHGKEEVR